MSEVSEENKRKLIKFSQEMFEQMQGQKDYPFKKWEDQFDEVRRMFMRGELSQRFLDFSVGEG